MNLLSPSERIAFTLDRLRGVGWLPRLVILGAAALFLGTVPAAGGTFHPVLSGVVLLVAAACMVTPDSAVPLLLMACLVGAWFSSVEDHDTPWVLAAMLLLVVVHVAATLSSCGPPGATPDGILVRRWARRTAFLASCGALSWLGGRLLEGVGVGRSGALLGVGLGLLIAWMLVLEARLEGLRGTAG